MVDHHVAEVLQRLARVFHFHSEQCTFPAIEQYIGECLWLYITAYGAILLPASDGIAEFSGKVIHGVGHGAATHFAGVTDLRAEVAQQTAVSEFLVAKQLYGRLEKLFERRQAIHPGITQRGIEQPGKLFGIVLGYLCAEIFFATEVVVEGALGNIDGTQEFLETDAVKTVFAEQFHAGIQQALSVLFGVALFLHAGILRPVVLNFKPRRYDGPGADKDGEEIHMMTAPADRCFTTHTLDFLRALAANNNRDWFNENKPVYELDVRQPALTFIERLAPRLAEISPHFLAIAKKSGGSLMRVYRDTRFSKDKTPYKTNIGIQFRHEQGRDVHAPGYYVHIDPQSVFVGVGLWRPDSRALGKIRDHLIEAGAAWVAARDDATFQVHFNLSGETLKRAPRGYSPDHPLIQDLKRKDFIAISDLSHEDVLSPDFIDTVCQRFRAADAYMRFLCKAIEVRM